jgi:reductive dehalogenase
MKGLGLVGAGFGGAAVVAPVFHDLDELASSDNSRKRAWWVKTVDEPTVEIDWSLMARHHGFHSAQSAAIVSRYCKGGPTEYTALVAKGSDLKTGILNNTPGLTLRDNALADAAMGMGLSGISSPSSPDPGYLSGPGVYGAPPQTPEQRGVPKWTGTPEENLQMMRAAMVFFGASDLGAAELNENHKKIIGLNGDNIPQTYFPYGDKPNWPPPVAITAPIEFKDVPKFSWDSQTGTTTIPSNIPLWSMCYTIPQSHEMMRTTPMSALFSAANITRYRLRENMRTATQGFLRGLGYQSLRDTPYRGIPSGASAGLTGLTENSRQTNMAISPEHGSTIGLYDMLTDLPLAPTKPIDAGIWRFCQTCGICAKHCPAGAIELKGGREPSYEVPASKITPFFPELPGLGFSPLGAGESEYNKTGRKTYWTDGVSCVLYFNSVPRGCAMCFGTCVFNSQYGALVHNVVRGTLANTSLFNGFFAQMDQSFGFGLVEGEAKEDWWKMSLPSYSYSTAVGARNGGYE